jgi:hypothetical protein
LTRTCTVSPPTSLRQPEENSMSRINCARHGRAPGNRRSAVAKPLQASGEMQGVALCGADARLDARAPALTWIPSRALAQEAHVAVAVNSGGDDESHGRSLAHGRGRPDSLVSS